jgi:hypothetical protein
MVKKSLFFDKGENEQSSFDARGLRDLALNIAKNAAILNDKIVPVLLQAANFA